MKCPDTSIVVIGDFGDDGPGLSVGEERKVKLVKHRDAQTISA